MHWVSKRRLPLLLGISAALYLLCLGAYYPGFFNDDAFFVIGARSLLQGRYVELNTPDLRPFDTHPPGYPFLLALWSVFGGSLASFQLLSVLLTVASIWLLHRLLKEQGHEDAAFAAAAAFALGPMTASLSGVILSEVLILPLALLVLLLSRVWWKTMTANQALALGALAGWAALARLSAAALWLALCLCLAAERRWRRAAGAAAAGAAVFVPWLLRNSLITGRAETRVSEMLDWQAGAAGLAASVLKSAAYYGHEAFARALFRCPPGWPFVEAAAATAGVLLLAWGLRAWGLRGERKFPVVFLALYAAVHLLWPYQSGRYLYPVLPLVAGFLFVGAAKAAGRRLAYGLLAASLFLSAFPVAAVLRASFGRDSVMSRPPERTYGWIRANTPANAVFAADLDGRLHLLTGRRAVHFPARAAREAFESWLKANPVDFALIFPGEPIMRRARGAAGANPLSPRELEALFADPRKFEPLFRDAQEGAIVYRVTKSGR